MNESGQRRVAIVVVGVTPHQGDGSAVTGRRATGDFVQAPVRIEELDLMDDPLRELEHLRKLAAAEPIKRFDRLYRLVGHIKLLTGAGERVRQNTGGRTRGPANVIASGAEQRVKLLCPECHQQHHPGGWYK